MQTLCAKYATTCERFTSIGRTMCLYRVLFQRLNYVVQFCAKDW